MRVNKLRKALAGDKPIFGMAFYSQSLAIMEIIGHSGFDFVFIDCGHTPRAIDTQLENVLRAADYAGLGTIVRVKGNDEHMIRNALEFGADAVCVPHIRCAADAEQLGLGALARTDVPEVQARFDSLLRKAAQKRIHVMGPALPATLDQARRLPAAGVKAILLRNDLACVKAVCKQYVDDIVGPIRGG